MQMTISQSDRVALQEALRQEKLCIDKYASYAQQAQDPQLQQMFNQHGMQEQQHANTLQQLLQGQQPSSGSASQSRQQGQPQSSQVWSANPNDMQLCSDLLMTENYVSNTYDDVVFCTQNSVIRQAVQHIQKEEQQHGTDIIDYMTLHGQYPAE